MKMTLIGNSLTIKTKKEMKKNLFMVAAVALMALVSCNKEEINNGVQETPVSDIVFEAETPMTKTTIGEADENGVRPVSWVVGDKITINGSEFKASELKGNKAIFVTENVDFTTAESYDAIYPATAGTSLSAVTIAAKQDGTFANASISVAQSETQSLSFKNVASMLKFQVPATASEVTIESTANLVGTFGVTFDNEGNPVIGQVSNGSKKITLTGSFVINTDYYVAILPGDHQFTVKIDGFLSKASTKTSTVERAKLMNMKKLPLDLIYLVPNGNWKADNARFAVYNFKDNTTSKWVDLKSYNGLYACERSALEYSTVIFCRMNPANKTNNWDNKWTQTGDMTIGDLPYCIIPFDVWEGSTVWSSTNKYDTSGYLHLAPNDNWLTQDDGKDPWFAAYFFGNGDRWIKMDVFSTYPKYYRVEIPKDKNFPSVIFCRMNAHNTTMNWDNRWNQSSDLKTNGGYFYKITGWDKTGNWDATK